jgi:hypothetical protein
MEMKTPLQKTTVGLICVEKFSYSLETFRLLVKTKMTGDAKFLLVLLYLVSEMSGKVKLS